MWKIVYNQLKNKSFDSIEEYIYYFLNLINKKDEIWSVKKVETLLTKQNGLFSESANIEKYFNCGHLLFIINYILNFPQINKIWFDFEDTYKNNLNLYEDLFNLKNKKSLFYHTLFLPEKLLSETSHSRQLSYLFLFFIPYHSGKSLLYHYLTDKPLLSYSELSNENFDMILEIMKDSIPEEFTFINSHKNINHLLIENFIEKTNNLFSFEENINWYNILPIYKMHRLFDENCSFKNFEQTMKKQYKPVFSDITNILSGIEKEYFYNKLNDSLQKKEKEKIEILKV